MHYFDSQVNARLSLELAINERKAMTNEDLQQFGTAIAGVLPTTLEPGDTDKHGNQYADIDAYDTELANQADTAMVQLEGKPF